MTSDCPLSVVEASADGTGHRHSVVTALNNPATDRVTGGAAVERGAATGGGGAGVGRGGAGVGRGGVGRGGAGAEAERVGGVLIL